jgi:signal transduction histidine kinase
MFSPRVRQWAFDGLVAAGIFGLTSLGIFMRVTPRPTMVLGFLMAVAILFRRRTPVLTMAVVASAALMQVILWPPGNDPLPYDLAVLVAMFSAVKYSKSIFFGYLAGLVVSIGIVIEVVRHWAPNWWAMALFYVGVCGGVWLMAYTMRTRRLYVRTLEERAASLERERDALARIAVADERASIARELHDVVAHSLAVMIVQADGGRYAIDTDPGRARQALETVAGTGREALEDMRRLVGVLRGGDEGGPAERRIHTLKELIERARSAGLTVLWDEQDLTLSPALELTVFRLVQESITNVIRHAGPAASVSLSLRRLDDRVEIEVMDDGAGSPLPAHGDGHGLIGMRERVAVHSGRLETGPLLTGGWRVFACLPVALEAA